jgi:charged multivesicular body protein 1
MNDMTMNLQMTGNSYKIQSLKAEREAEQEKLLVKKAMEKGDMERARIHAERAIRKYGFHLFHFNTKLERMRVLGSFH